MNLAEMYEEAKKAKEKLQSLNAGIRDLYTATSPDGVAVDVLYPVAKELLAEGWVLSRRRKVGHLTWEDKVYYLSPLEIAHTSKQARRGGFSQTELTPEEEEKEG